MLMLFSMLMLMLLLIANANPSMLMLMLLFFVETLDVVVQHYEPYMIARNRVLQAIICTGKTILFCYKKYI